MATYDVFISYRRDGGGAEARLIQGALQSRRVRAFLDVTELGRGYFDDALLKSIEQTPNFVVILSPHALDRAESDEDWLRKEIAHALKSERNVVPLIMPGFQFPPKLPRDLKNLPRHQGMDYSHLYFDAMMQKLVATLDLAASDEERARQERLARERDDGERAERLKLEQERLTVERERLTVEQMRRETEDRRRSLEMKQHEDRTRREDASHGTDRAPGPVRWSDRLRLGDAAASTEVRQAAVVAFWSLLLVSFAWFATASGNEAQGGFTAATVFLVLAIWMRASPTQAATTGLVVSALTTIGMVGTALSQRFDSGRMSFAWYAACATAAIWQLSRATRLPAAPVPVAPPIGEDAPVRPGRVPFGTRFGDFIGVGPNRNDRRLQWFIGARFLAGIAFWWTVPDYQRTIAGFHVNVLWVAWVSAALPLALAFTYRSLRNPLLAIGASAVIASVADPAFYQTGMATLSIAGNLVGSLLLAAVFDEVERKPVAAWIGCAAANLAGVALWQLWGLRFGGWFQAGPVLYRFTLLSLVFTAVFVIGIFATRRKA